MDKETRKKIERVEKLLREAEKLYAEKYWSADQIYGKIYLSMREVQRILEK